MLVSCLLLLALAGPGVWLGIRTAMQAAAEEAVDTQLRTFGLQIRAAMASAEALTGVGPADGTRPPGPPAIALGDLEWIWQIGIGGVPVQRSEWLRLSGITLPPGVDGPSGDFVVHFADTPLGPMRIAERLVDEGPRGSAPSSRLVHYLVGIPQARYQDMVTDYVRDLGRLTLLITGPALAVLVLALAILLLVLRRSMADVDQSLVRFQAGETDRIEGRFPRELQDLVDRVNDLMGRNARLLARTRRYVSKIAHDLNHPLTVLQNGLPDDGEAAHLRRQITRMTGLIDRYASLAQALGPDAVAAPPLAIRPVLDDVRDGFALLYRQPPVTITVACDDAVAFPIPREDLAAMAGNLAGNAHRFAAWRIGLAASLDGGDLVIVVDDDGPGIPEDQREQAVRWGERLDEAPPGSGFGLAIVADLADLHGGALRLGTSPWGGLRATLRFPDPGAGRT